MLQANSTTREQQSDCQTKDINIIYASINLSEPPTDEGLDILLSALQTHFRGVLHIFRISLEVLKELDLWTGHSPGVDLSTDLRPAQRQFLLIELKRSETKQLMIQKSILKITQNTILQFVDPSILLNEISDFKVYLSNLPINTTIPEIYKHFSRRGKITKIKMLKQRSIKKHIAAEKRASKRAKLTFKNRLEALNCVLLEWENFKGIKVHMTVDAPKEGKYRQQELIQEESRAERPLGLSEQIESNYRSLRQAGRREALRPPNRALGGGRGVLGKRGQFQPNVSWGNLSNFEVMEFVKEISWIILWLGGHGLWNVRFNCSRFRHRLGDSLGGVELFIGEELLEIEIGP